MTPETTIDPRDVPPVVLGQGDYIQEWPQGPARKATAKDVAKADARAVADAERVRDTHTEAAFSVHKDVNSPFGHERWCIESNHDIDFPPMLFERQSNAQQACWNANMVWRAAMTYARKRIKAFGESL